MDSITIEPIARVDGTITIPGSKSLSNRTLLLAALSNGKTLIKNLLDSDDIRHMLNAFTKLGIQYELSADKTECTVEGLGGPINNEGELIELFLGNAGTAMRPLAAALCLGDGEFLLTGEPRMLERPIGHLIDALKQAGADVEYTKDEGYPPLHIRGKGLQGGRVEIDGSVSSQFLTALLMAAPLAKADTEIVVKDELVSKALHRDYASPHGSVRH